MVDNDNVRGYHGGGVDAVISVDEVTTVVYFQDGLMGWLAQKRPEWFGMQVEEKVAGETH